jgi:hypothetical protein
MLNEFRGCGHEERVISPSDESVWAMGTRSPNLGPWDFPATAEKGHAVKKLAETLQAETVRYKLSLGWEAKTEIPA